MNKPLRVTLPRLASRASFFRLAGLVLASGLAWCGAAFAVPVAVPNADFSVAGNNGTVGGGLIGGSGSGPIGAGPWRGNYHGILGLLAPPALTVGMGTASASGIAGANLLGLVNNGGYFSQAVGTNFLPNKRYLLSADVDAGAGLGLALLQTGNAGLAIANGSTRLASTVTAAASLITITPIGGTTSRVTLRYDTGPTASGPISVLLLAEPSGVLNVNVAGTVRFDNVALSASALNPIPASIAPFNNSPQGVPINTQFPQPLRVQVLDPDGDPVPGATVTFTVVSGTGAGATLSSVTAVTDANGIAQITATSNGTVGSYTIEATVSGVAGSASFPLSNINGVPASLDTGGGTPQSATVAQPFSSALSVIVKDSGGNPVQGVSVTFSAPTSGPSATLSPIVALTDANGVATTNATANTVAGLYTITASVNGTADTATYDLNNLAGPAAQVLPSAGSGQTATVYMPFAGPLEVRVADAYGNPVSGVLVTFGPPASGPSAVLSSPTATTNAAGVAQVTATANGFPGPYTITATAAGVGTGTNFVLTNSADSTVVLDYAHNNWYETTYLGTAFQCILRVHVNTGGGSPAAGIAIRFDAPTSGASADLSGNGASITQLTNASGNADVLATANNFAGRYTVSATIVGTANPPFTFDLVNIDPESLDIIFRDNFEGNLVEPVDQCPQ